MGRQGSLKQVGPHKRLHAKNSLQEWALLIKACDEVCTLFPKEESVLSTQSVFAGQHGSRSAFRIQGNNWAENSWHCPESPRLAAYNEFGAWSACWHTWRQCGPLLWSCSFSGSEVVAGNGSSYKFNVSLARSLAWTFWESWFCQWNTGQERMPVSFLQVASLKCGLETLRSIVCFIFVVKEWSWIHERILIYW